MNIEKLTKFIKEIEKFNEKEKELISQLNYFQTKVLEQLFVEKKVLINDALKLTDLSRAQKYRALNFLLKNKLVKKNKPFLTI